MMISKHCILNKKILGITTTQPTCMSIFAASNSKNKKMKLANNKILITGGASGIGLG